ncbi:hypothetical protein ACCS53_38900, partial [Rhizobium ruizarguesonis]
ETDFIAHHANDAMRAICSGICRQDVQPHYGVFFSAYHLHDFIKARAHHFFDRPILALPWAQIKPANYTPADTIKTLLPTL